MRSTVWVVDPKLPRTAAEAIVASLGGSGVRAAVRDLPAGLAVVIEEAPPGLAVPDGVVRAASVEVPPAVTRRAFLDAFAGALALAVAAAGAGVAATFASPPPRERRDDDDAEIEVTTVTDLAAKGSVRFQFGREPCILIHRQGRIHALSLVCTHLGCLVEWRPELGQLTCPCHRASFGIEGNVIEGPPPRPLTSLAVSVVNDRVLVRRRTES